MIWLEGRDSSPQGFPLQRLVRAVRAAVGNERVFITKSLGYGLAINALQPAEIGWDDLDRLSHGVDEWFYDIELKLLPSGFRFGLHDSHALFIEGPKQLTGLCVEFFSNAEKMRVR